MTTDGDLAELAGACADVSAASPADTVGSRRARYVAAPGSTKEAADLLAAAARRGLSVVPRGAGTRLDWGALPASCDLLVDTRRLSRVIEHAAGDLVVSVQAGVRVDVLATVLNAAGQRLAIDPPGARRNCRRPDRHRRRRPAALSLRLAARPAHRHHDCPAGRNRGQGRRQGGQERGWLRHRQAVRRIARHPGPDYRGHLQAAPAPCGRSVAGARLPGRCLGGNGSPRDRGLAARARGDRARLALGGPPDLRLGAARRRCGQRDRARWPPEKPSRPAGGRTAAAGRPEALRNSLSGSRSGPVSWRRSSTSSGGRRRLPASIRRSAVRPRRACWRSP